MTRHPSDVELIELAGGGGPRGTTEEHIATGCARCEAKLREYRILLSGLTAQRLFGEPPTVAIDRAAVWLHKETVRTIGVARAAEGAGSTVPAARPIRDRSGRPGLIRRAASAWQRIEAALIFDSAAAPAMAGVRSAGTARSRHLLYRGGVGTLHIEIEVLQSGKRSLSGQFVLAGVSDAKTGRLTVTAGERRIERRLVADQPFRIQSIPAGTTTIEVQWGEQLLVVPPLPE